MFIKCNAADNEMHGLPTRSISTQGGSTVPPILSSSVFQPLKLMLTLVSNFITASGVRVTFSSAWPPTGTTPCTGLTVKPGSGLGSSTYIF